MSLKSICVLLECRQLLNNKKTIGCIRCFASHYDILKVKRNCTQQEIRESFLKLSKQHHPDVNKSKESHEKFLKINEAYKVLSKPGSRQLYDLGFSNPAYVEVRSSPGRRGPSRVVYGEQMRNPWDDPSFYKNRDKSQDQFYERQAYYGIRGINKMANTTIAFICIFIATIGLILQALAIRFSFTLNREKLERQSKEANELWLKAREAALTNSTQEQIEIFRKCLEEINKNKP